MSQNLTWLVVSGTFMLSTLSIKKATPGILRYEVDSGGPTLKLGALFSPKRRERTLRTMSVSAGVGTLSVSAGVRTLFVAIERLLHARDTLRAMRELCARRSAAEIKWVSSLASNTRTVLVPRNTKSCRCDGPSAVKSGQIAGFQ